MGACKVLYRPERSVGEIARQIIDDVLAAQAGFGGLIQGREDAARALCNIQRQARQMLGVEERQAAHRLDGLVELITRMENGEPIRVNELRQTLVTIEVAAAKIKRHLGGVADGLEKPAA